MHRTSSTNLSDTMLQLSQFSERLEDARWMPIEELMGMLAAGVIALDAIFEHTSPDMFSEDEKDFIDVLYDAITKQLNEIQTSDNYE